MIRVVVDTNVLVRYLIRPGAATRGLIEEAWVAEEFLMVTSPQLIEELEDVLARPRIQALVPLESAVVLVEMIRERAELVEAPDVVPSYTRDPKDDMFVACAIAGRANFLVTEDLDLLVLDGLMDVRMVTPYGFIRVSRDAPSTGAEEGDG